MFREVDLREALMATLEGKKVYVFNISTWSENGEKEKPIIDRIGLFRLDELLSDSNKGRYIVDEYEDATIEFIATTEFNKDLPFTPEKSELEGFATYDPTVKHKGGRYPKVDVGKLMALHNAGWDEDKIAGELGITRGTVMKYLREARENDEAIYDKIKALLDSGLSDVQIANELDMPRETVLRYLREEGAKDD